MFLERNKNDYIVDFIFGVVFMGLLLTGCYISFFQPDIYKIQIIFLILLTFPISYVVIKYFIRK